ncbi:hypothetical protein IWW55_001178 [Coemansia sp. RSA 2706]|nr:hypothetical protein IWW55_001178 [Coemansia sp. RSA 2706]KAJ2312918.1 hypothetical protein IWW54_001807 [Coemansia sp. RSA 2705]KAJ2317185.1 hypothetical protein IWW52_003259 [Coemansia sp. RSA 2704]
MANTAISADVMRGVLEQLPLMSGAIVDDTRHEKVLSYMRLFLHSESAVAQLLQWDVLGVVRRCLEPQMDHRVSAVAVRFLGDMLCAHGGHSAWTALGRDPHVLGWIASSVDSPQALLRLSCLYFVRMAARFNDDEQFAALLQRLDPARLLLRRLLDSSYFVSAEASKLFASLFARADAQLHGLAERMAAWPFPARSAVRQNAVLAVAETLFALGAGARELALRRFTLAQLEPYLFGADRLVRDKALDVLELRLGAADADEALRLVEEMRRKVRADLTPATVLVVLRCLAALVKQQQLRSPDVCQSVVDMALSLLVHLDSPSWEHASVELVGEPTAATKDIAQDIAETLAARPKQAAAVSCECARIVREHCRGQPSRRAAETMYAQLASARVQQHPQLLQLVLDASVRALRGFHSADTRVLPKLIGSFAIRAPGLQGLLELALETLEGDAGFAAQLEPALRVRIADVEWEARDSALECVGRALRTLPWAQTSGLVTRGMIDDAANALADPEEYVRAAAAQLLTAAVERGDAASVHMVERHAGLARDALARVLADSEALVKRAGLDMVCALAARSAGAEWQHALSHRALRVLAEDPDFEVRVRCARLLARLAALEHGGELAGLGELQSGMLLLSMFGDSSRYVRQACLDGVRELKQQQQQQQQDAAGDGEPAANKRPRQTDATRQFYDKLAQVDFRRLEQSLTAEHLYQEALDTQVERELMAEPRAANAGNNILDCY